ncbi:A/G-specific DNA-adenine glycosylase [Anseongella ginsenosidimutans]|uniref:Adenine DNA glycosylase n=1 Tax=Anseongella ginsenosidimutans TaxID=496056 RepID=A0A4R3KUN6_9SPHI|nr:A/G-specific adenine glycosylase [Anseongella ginsenosidimutans]QEC51769.1 A/G-specific adenine glycosylase [Anseongella ginsenosidimutans]TCS89137.1 A/G-specific DNA-adenine glycosylase [Anseongella ginsenosidimutans]
MDFAKIIANWYRANKRDLPWRETKDPYLIWLSEIILQQTRVEQGLPYYYRFAERFPTVADLADADEDQVMKLWQGLGYYSRARNMHATAKTVYQQRGRAFPSSYSELIRLKGIGEYTASAISSFAANEARAVVDGNVYRLLSRYSGAGIPIDTTAGKKYFSALAADLLDKDDPGVHNQAVMEFGARQCRPARPFCSACPLASGCAALKEGKVGLLPVKSKRPRTRERYFNYLMIRDKGQIWLNKRGSGDIWQSLYDFPLVETPAPVDEAGLFQLEDFRKILKDREYLVISVSQTLKHVLSHQVIHARFWELELKGYLKPESKYITVEEKEMEAYAFPKLITNYLENNL